MDNLLTDRAFWETYWTRKEGLAYEIPLNFAFHPLLTPLIEHYKYQTAIELGGFPGYYAVFLKKYFNISSTLLDYFIHKPIVDELLLKNKFEANQISLIEADLFQYTPEKTYDLVLSCGLIEHFQDTQDIIKRHVDFLKPGGTLFITLPNFTGINGWFQKKFDLDNYEKHNIASMNPHLLRNIAQNLGLENISSNYYGKFSVWFEEEQRKPFFAKMCKHAAWWMGKLWTKTLYRKESKALSPYIVLVAQKPNEHYAHIGCS